jgi:hypothetical protein
MSLKILQLAAAVENSDEFNEARLLLLLKAAAGKEETAKPLDGIMKLAKMDFLLRYPNMLVRALNVIGESKKSALAAAAAIPEEDRDTIEARMIRFRFGPWDPRYRRWLSILVAKQLAIVYREGRTVKIQLSKAGMALAEQLAEVEAFKPLAERARIVNSAVGSMPSTKITAFVYKIAPEIVNMKWGNAIEL